MNKLNSYKICSECNKEMERCRAASVDDKGNVIYVCRRCWRDLEYDNYLYLHRQWREGAAE